MNWKRFMLIVLLILIIYIAATNTVLANTVLGDMLTTLLRWLSDIYHFLTNSTGAHP